METKMVVYIPTKLIIFKRCYNSQTSCVDKKVIYHFRIVYYKFH